MNKALSYVNSNKVYFSLTAIATLNAYLINYFNTVCNCSVSFVLFLFTVNLIHNYFGTNKAIYATVAALSTAYTTQAGLPYHIHGQLMPELIKFSLLSTAVSVTVGLKLMSYSSAHYAKNSFMVRNWVCIMLTVLIDGSVMAMYFANIYKPVTCLNIFIKGIGYKSLFTTSLFAVSSVVKMIMERQE